MNSIQSPNGTRAVDGYFAQASLPVRISEDDASRIFTAPLEDELARLGLGRVVCHSLVQNAQDEPEGVIIQLSLIADTVRVLEAVAGVLDTLGAPVGSTLGHAECPDLVHFGRTRGLGLYLEANGSVVHPMKRAKEVARACRKALDGAELFQGSFSTSDRAALYFYGDSLARMQSAITYVMSTNPGCRNAFARKLN